MLFIQCFDLFFPQNKRVVLEDPFKTHLEHRVKGLLHHRTPLSCDVQNLSHLYGGTNSQDTHFSVSSLSRGYTHNVDAIFF